MLRYILHTKTAPTIGDSITGTSDEIPLMYEAVVLWIPYLSCIHWLQVEWHNDIFKQIEYDVVSCHYDILAPTI